MESAPRVSVVLPTYNRAHLLPRALRSVLAQTYRAFEVLVVDDGSTDETAGAVAGLADPRIRFHRVNHQGCAGAMNVAIQHALGEWVAFIDSDDEWAPAKLERQMQAAAAAGPEVGVIYSAGVIVDDAAGREIHARRPRAGGQGRVFDLMLETNWFSFVSVLARRRCFDEVGLFDEGLAFGEDRDWLLRAARRFEFRGLAEPLVTVHVHRGPRQTADLAGRIAFAQHILERYREDLGARPLLAARKQVALGQLCLREGDVARARRAFAEAMRVRPTFVPAYAHLAISWGPWRLWHSLSRWRLRRRGRRAVAALHRQETAP